MTERGHPSFKPPGQAENVKVKILDFQLTKGGAIEYTLEDGTIVRLQPQLTQVLKQIDEDGNPVLNSQGTPIYHFSFGIQTQVIPKDRTIYVPKPPSSPQATPPATMTV